MVDHGAGVFTAYHHLSAINVTQGHVTNTAVADYLGVDVADPAVALGV